MSPHPAGRTSRIQVEVGEPHWLKPMLVRPPDRAVHGEVDRIRRRETERLLLAADRDLCGVEEPVARELEEVPVLVTVPMIEVERADRGAPDHDAVLA